MDSSSAEKDTSRKYVLTDYPLSLILIQLRSLWTWQVVDAATNIHTSKVQKQRQMRISNMVHKAARAERSERRLRERLPKVDATDH